MFTVATDTIAVLARCNSIPLIRWRSTMGAGILSNGESAMHPDYLSITIGNAFTGTAEGDHALIALVILALAVLVSIVLRPRLGR